MSSIAIKTVRTIEEWLQCQHIRAAAFLHSEPYEEEFDGNDFEMVVHILARLGKNPAACMRLSLYSTKNGGTIHWGRLAMMPNLDSRKRLTILNSIADYAEEYSNHNKFERIIGEVADKRLMKFWNRRGFSLTGEPPICYGNREYFPMGKQMVPYEIFSKGKLYNDNAGRSSQLQ